MKIADLVEDQKILFAASRAADFILSEDPTLSFPNHQELKQRVNELFSANRRIEFN